MFRFQSKDEILSILYVNFDNLYIRLLEQSESLGRTFATNPQRWLRWIEGHALRMMYGDGTRRRILKRYCYMCPDYYQEFRHFFLKTAFHVAECPSLVNNNSKTNADIQLVMDCLDGLNHTTKFDEFIILSGDTDFTPLLLRIQECARRSLVLSAGYTSPAYAAACSWRIREDWFVAQALDEVRLEGLENKEERQGNIKTLPKGVREPSMAARPDHEYGDQGQRCLLNLSGGKRSQLLEIINQTIMESSVPVPLPSLSQVIQREIELSPDWFGAGTLRELLEQLDLEPLEFSNINQGVVFDPSRHERPFDNNMLDDFAQ